ncbi:type VI secretion system baseplate subunit TssF [Vibrio harveyi]|nr:type VI secretion system baseplate subunit TssF [Vibrio harveyi]
MSEEFLKYYNRELAYLRHKGQEFGEQYPKIAARLGINEEQVDDPHVERLLEGCAFMTARIRQSLDNSYPQFTESLMGQLHPDFHAPIPSMSIIRMKCNGSTSSPFDIPAGEKVKISAPGFDECEFKTCYDTQIYPCDVSQGSFDNAPLASIGSRWETNAHSMLKLRLNSNESGATFAGMGVETLRFYLNGQTQLTQRLYQLLFKSLIGISLSANGKEIASLTPRHLHAVGFHDSHKVVPYRKRSFSSARMLVEYLHFPEKFMFFELQDLALERLEVEGELDISFYFDIDDDWLPKQVDEESVLLGCVPIINLYESTMEPTRLEASEYEYQMSPGHQSADCSEVVAITDVTLNNWNKSYKNLPSYFAGEHNHYMNKSDLFWVMRREDKNWAGGFDEPGRDIYISFVNKKHQQFEFDSHDSWLLSVKAECCNRNMPQKLPFGGGLPNVLLPKVSDNFQQVKCLVSMTETIRPDMDEGSRWQLTKLLTLSHFTDETGLATLKQRLKLYAFAGTAETKALIDALVKLEYQQTTGRVNERGRVGFAHGVKLVLTVSDQMLSKEQTFFLGCVLSVYFAQFAEVNIFTQLEVKTKSTDKVFHRWPAMLGEKVLL